MALWTPSNLTVPPLYWYDAQDAATITQSSGAVSQWSDKGSGAANGTQSTAGAKPTYNASSSNFTGLPTLSFDGGDFLAASYGTRIDTVLVDVRTPGSITAIGLELWDGAAAVAFSSSTITTLLTPTIVEMAWSTSALAFYRTGNTAGTRTAGTGFAKAGAYFSAVRLATTGGGSGFGRHIDATGIGNRTDLARGMVGELGETIYLGYNPTTTERQLIEGYMAWRWGVQAQLPVGHPYAGGAPTLGSVGAASGTSAVAAIGAASIAGAGSAAGTSSAVGVGQSVGAGIGAAASTSSAGATGRADSLTVGNAAGTSSAAAVGTATGGQTGVGNAVGTSGALATGRADSLASGLAAGTSVALAVGAYAFAAAGQAAGMSVAVAFSETGGSIGLASGTSSAAAIGSEARGAVGYAVGTSLAVAYSPSPWVPVPGRTIAIEGGPRIVYPDRGSRTIAAGGTL